MLTAWPLTGRDEELRIVSEALGEDPTSGVVLAGSAGVGKTRLAQEAMDGAARGGAATLWAVATASAASIPLGALAHVLPPLPPRSPPDPVERLRQASAALVEAAGGRRLVLGVDDAHLLDAASATLVHQLALTGGASLMITVRSGEPAPDPVVALWKDALVERLELQPLSRREVGQLLAAVVGAPVDSATVERLWALTRGNALFMREVVDAAKEADQLVSREGVWRWQGELTPTARLGELVGSRLARLGSDARRLVEALAFGEPLGACLAPELVSDAALAEADRAGAVTLEVDGRRRQVRLSHPLYAEVLRAESSVLHARDLRRDLAGVLGSRGRRRRGDVLRQATLQLDFDGDADADLLTLAAAEANSAFDTVLAERLARAAIAGGAGVRAHVALGSALYGQGRSSEADEVLAHAAALAAGDEEHSAVALAWAPTLFWGRSRGDDAEAVLARAEERIADARVARGISAVRALFALFTGRPETAVEIAAPVLSLPSDADAAVWATVSTSLARARCGRTAEALEVNARGWALLDPGLKEPLHSSVDHALFPLLFCELTALWAAGRHAEAEARAAAFHEQVITRGDGHVAAVPCLLRGQAALAAGHPTSAARWLREAAADLVDNDPVGWLHWCLLSLAEALAITSEPLAAAQALAHADTVRRPAFVLWAADALLAEAWVAVGGGEVTRAAILATKAAAVAAQSSQWTVEAFALHVAVRLDGGRDVAGRLRELARECDGSLVSTCAAHATGLAARDGDALDQVSERFAAMGARLLAAEAAAQACAAHDGAGRRVTSWVSAGRARELAEGCEGASTPALAQTRALPLTRREREVAGLAAQGLGSRAIAERLVVSVRTVEGHLDQAYAKLGINGRGELATALGAAPGQAKNR